MKDFRRYKFYLSLVGILCLFSLESIAQKDTTHLLNSVQIIRERDSIYLVPRMTSIKDGAVITIAEIERKKPIDLGELTRSFPGVFLKSYGGVGGLKTMNARGLGSQHFLVLINGIAYLQNQSGSANLGNIQTDFIETVKYSTGGTDEWMVPVLSKTYSGVLQVFTTDQLFIPNKSKVEVSTLAGSFGHYKAGLNTYFSNKKAYISANGYGMSYKGNYPFTYENGYQKINSTRLNNNIGEVAFRFGTGIQLKNNRLQAGANYYKSDKQLPGAIIFYQPANSQTLNVSQLNFNFTHTFLTSKFRQRNEISWNEGKTNYIDPYYVGQIINENYRERNLDISHVNRLRLDKNDKLALTWGMEYMYTDLVANTNNVMHPQRHRGIANVGFSANLNRWKFMTDLPVQALIEKDLSQTKWKQTYLFTPSAGFSRQFSIKKTHWNAHINYASTARVASFNELFYGKTGNVHLNPEKAQMGTIGFSTAYFSKNGFSITGSANGFGGWIKDKIVTIPTKNLFMWSVRNVGQVLSYGFDGDITFGKSWKNEKFKISTIQKTALTVARDYTDKESSTYRQQIPYTPYWNYSGEFIVDVYDFQLSWESSYSGFRFALGENIAENVVNEYWLHNLRIAYNWKIKKGNHAIRIYAKLNNITNKQYQVIRSFPMPGRNVEIGLKYAWNKHK